MKNPSFNMHQSEKEVNIVKQGPKKTKRFGKNYIFPKSCEQDNLTMLLVVVVVA